MIPIPGAGKAIILVIALAAVSGTIFAGYRYVKGLQEENALLASNNAKLEVAVDLKEAENTSLKEGLAAMAQESAKLNEALERARASRRKAKRIFDDHDFTALLNEKPGLIEQRMVSGTDRMFRAIEQASKD